METEEDIISKEKKSKKDITINKTKWKKVFFIFALVLIVSFFIALPFFRDNYLSWRLWVQYIILIVIVQLCIWRRIALWLRDNKEKIFPKTVEYFFFIFIFLSSYLLSFLIDKRYPLGIVSIFFVFSAISAAYCGELYFLEGISDSRTIKELKKTFKPGEERHYDERIIIFAYFIIFTPSIFILKFFFGINSKFLYYFSFPVFIFMGMYISVFYLTKGQYYKKTWPYIKIFCSLIIIGIFLGIFLSNFDFVSNFILNLFSLENIDINIQINNFIETFL